MGKRSLSLPVTMLARLGVWVVDGWRQDVEMSSKLDSILPMPIAFAHRGARAHAPENTLESFALALKLGATGIETDVWISADGSAVLDHDGEVGRWPKRRPISDVARRDLPSHIPTMDEFYESLGTEFEFSIDVKDPKAFDPIISAARNAGNGAESRLWLCHPSYQALAAWRNRTSARLVDSTRLAKIKEGPERRANALRNAGIDAVNLRQTDWTGGLVAIFHRYERFALGWDAQHAREIATLVNSGIDGVFSDHVDRMVETIGQFFPTQDRSA